MGSARVVAYQPGELAPAAGSARLLGCFLIEELLMYALTA